MEVSTQTEPLDYFELPSSVTVIKKGVPTTRYGEMKGFTKKVTNLLFTAVPPLLPEGETLFNEMYKLFLCKVNFFEFYSYVAESQLIKERTNVLVKCQYRGDIVINACVDNIVYLVSHFRISDSYVKSFLAFCGKSQEIFDLYKDKNYRQFVIDCFVKLPIVEVALLTNSSLVPGDLVSYFVIPGNLFSYFVMERDPKTTNLSYQFLRYVHRYRECNLQTHKDPNWISLKNRVAMLKPLQLMGMLRYNKQLMDLFLEDMGNYCKAVFLINFIIDPLVDQLEKGDITDIYVKSFIYIFRLKFSAFEFFNKGHWAKFLSVIATA